MLKDVLIRLCLPIENLRGYSYDVASNVSGRYNGVQALICQEQPTSYYTSDSQLFLKLPTFI